MPEQAALPLVMILIPALVVLKHKLLLRQDHHHYTRGRAR